MTTVISPQVYQRLANSTAPASGAADIARSMPCAKVAFIVAPGTKSARESQPNSE